LESNNPLRVGVIGLGKMGLLHLGILNALKDTKVVAYAEPQEIVRRYMKCFCPNIQAYVDYNEMIRNEELHAVVIATPTFTHNPIIRACVKAKKHFLVEKPLGLSANDSRDIVNVVRGSNLVNLVGYACMRYSFTFARAKEIFDSGAIGTPHAVKATMYVDQVRSRSRGWQYDPDLSGGGVLNNFASHLIYLLYWYFGNVTVVDARFDSVHSDRVEDSCQASLLVSKGLACDFATSWSKVGYSKPEAQLVIEGDRGTLKVSDDRIEIDLDRTSGTCGKGRSVIYRPDIFKGVEFELGGPEYTIEDRHFIDCVKTGTQTSVDVEVGFEIQKIISAIYSMGKAS
jgi:predicted dehydrogenase